MKILVYCLNYAPEMISTAKYTTEMCEWLAKRGHQVRVITAQPYYPKWQIFPGYKAWQYNKETINGININRCPIWIPQQPTALKRILHLCSFALSSIPTLCKHIVWRPDIVFFIEPTMFCWPMALLFGSVTSAHTVLHIQDFELDAAFGLKLLNHPWLRKILNKIEQWLMQRCSMVSTISPKMQEKLMQKGVTTPKLALFPNWVDTTIIHPIAKNDSLRGKLNISPDACVCLYSGNLGEKQGLEIIIQAAAKLQQTQQQYVFIICGSGPAETQLKHLATQLQINNFVAAEEVEFRKKSNTTILWLPLQQTEYLNRLLNTADIHLLPQKAAVADLVMPSKLTAMLASGKPIVTTALPHTQVYDVVKHCGIPTPPENLTEFVTAISYLQTNPEQCAIFSANARNYAEMYLSKTQILTDYEQLLEKLCRHTLG